MIKCESMLFELAEDFHDVIAAMPVMHPRHRIMELLAKAIRRDANFIAENPKLLLQCLWHTCYWHDAPEAAQHYAWKKSGRIRQNPKNPAHPWNQNEPKLCTLLETWVKDHLENATGAAFLRSMHPSGTALDSPVLTVCRPEDRVQRVCISEGGQTIAAGSWNGRSVIILDSRSGRQRMVFSGHMAGVSAVAMTPDGRWVVSGSGSGENLVRLWNVENGELAKTFTGHKAGINAVAITPAGDRVFSAAGAAVRVWDCRSGECIREINAGNPRESQPLAVFGLAVTVDGERLAAASDIVSIWNRNTGDFPAQWDPKLGIHVT